MLFTETNVEVFNQTDRETKNNGKLVKAVYKKKKDQKRIKSRWNFYLGFFQGRIIRKIRHWKDCEIIYSASPPCWQTAVFYLFSRFFFIGI